MVSRCLTVAGEVVVPAKVSRRSPAFAGHWVPALLVIAAYEEAARKIDARQARGK